MKRFLLHLARYIALLLLLLATALFVIRYPTMWAPVESTMRWTWMPRESFVAIRTILPFLFAFGWFAYFVAARRMGRLS